MEHFKNVLMLGLCVPAVLWSIYEGYNVIGYVKTLSEGDCFKSNPYRLELFFGT